jgi:hypothetical protein
VVEFAPFSFLFLLAVLIITLCMVAVLGRDALAKGELWAVFVVSVSLLLCVVVTGVIWRQPESKTKLSFKVSRRIGAYSVSPTRGPPARRLTLNAPQDSSCLPVWGVWQRALR